MTYPVAPVDGSTYTIGGVDYAYTAATDSYAVVPSAAADPTTWTTATRPAAPATGQQGLNTDLGYIEYWNGAIWVETGGGAALPADAAGVLTNDGLGGYTWETAFGGLAAAATAGAEFLIPLGTPAIGDVYRFHVFIENSGSPASQLVSINDGTTNFALGGSGGTTVPAAFGATGVMSMSQTASPGGSAEFWVRMRTATLMDVEMHSRQRNVSPYQASGTATVTAGPLFLRIFCSGGTFVDVQAFGGKLN